jgi:tRNA (guanine-N7-)-methyltransferase
VAHLLPRYALPDRPLRLDLKGLFPPRMARFALEVGFGAGEHLSALARESADCGLIGCEPYLNGVAQLLARLADAPLANLRLHHGDAREVLARLADASLDAVYILFPDPWPKKRHWKRRFISEETLNTLARVLRAGGELRLSTDSGAYARWTLEKARASRAFSWLAEGPGDWRARAPGAIETRYEAKARAAGRAVYHLRFARVSGGA